MNDRKTRRFKEKRSMFPFGQLMLPIIGVVAIGLLVIGIKLFFFPASNTSVVMAIPETTTETTLSKQQPENPVKPAGQNQDTAKPMEATSKVESVPVKRSEPVLAVPVAETAQAAPRIEPTPKTPATSISTVENRPVKKTGSKSKEISASSSEKKTSSTWGVQIGAFTTKQSAASVLSKAKTQGFDGELNQAQVNGKVFYRVRIPSGNSRETAATMAKKLKGKGYPTLVVPLTD